MRDLTASSGLRTVFSGEISPKETAGFNGHTKVTQYSVDGQNPKKTSQSPARTRVVGVPGFAFHFEEGACFVLQHFVLPALGLICPQGHHLVKRTYILQDEIRAGILTGVLNRRGVCRTLLQ